MKKEVKDLWVKALRSGEFVQTHSKLENGPKSYCALGVLAVLALVEGVCTYNVGGKYDGRTMGISYNIMNWAGIAQYDELYLEPGAEKVQVVCKGKKTSIADLNDSGLSFLEIADIIEKSWRDL